MEAHSTPTISQVGLCKGNHAVGCAISARAVEDLEKIRPYEPNIVKAAWNIFGDSYRYRDAYNRYKEKRRQEEK